VRPSAYAIDVGVMARSIPTNPEKDPEEIQGLFLSYINSFLTISIVNHRTEYKPPQRDFAKCVY
jgi:hypothetical protein